MRYFIFSLHYTQSPDDDIDPSHFGPYQSVKEAYEGFLRTGEKMSKEMSNDLPVLNWYYDLEEKETPEYVTYEQVTFAELGFI